MKMQWNWLKNADFIRPVSYTTASGKTTAEIQNAEKLLGVKFSNQFWDFNAKYGYLSFYGNEIFGADPDHLDEMEGNRVL